MNKTCATALLSLSLLTTPAFAGGLADPIVAPEVVAADATASSDALDSLVPALFVMLLILNVAGAF